MKNKYKNNYVVGQLFYIKESCYNGIKNKKIAITNGEYILLHIDAGGKRVFIRYASGGGATPSSKDDSHLTLYPRDNKYVDIHKIKF